MTMVFGFLYMLKIVLSRETNHKHKPGNQLLMTACPALQTSMTTQGGDMIFASELIFQVELLDE